MLAFALGIVASCACTFGVRHLAYFDTLNSLFLFTVASSFTDHLLANVAFRNSGLTVTPDSTIIVSGNCGAHADHVKSILNLHALCADLGDDWAASRDTSVEYDTE